ncbi:MAG: hypothetical protein KTR16_15815 [Acidiferrobacterales bacterium]|nr:hypothetical protein [Acidiferrobacterales bacterium]
MKVRNQQIGNRLACLLAALFSVAYAPLALADDESSKLKSSLMWLSDDIGGSNFDDSQYNSFFGKSELWGDRWGVSANVMQNDKNDVFGFPDDSQFFNLDVKRRFGSRDKSNVELGLGWQELNIDSILEASGPRVSLGGKLNLFSSFQVYGTTSYFPELADDLENNDGTAYEVEAGVLYSPFPSVSLKAGYRHFSLDIEENSFIEEIGSSSGFLLGTDWSW